MCFFIEQGGVEKLKINERLKKSEQKGEVKKKASKRNTRTISMSYPGTPKATTKCTFLYGSDHPNDMKHLKSRNGWIFENLDPTVQYCKNDFSKKLFFGYPQRKRKNMTMQYQNGCNILTFSYWLGFTPPPFVYTFLSSCNIILDISISKHLNIKKSQQGPFYSGTSLAINQQLERDWPDVILIRDLERIKM